ncbi:hypothetical protein Ana3638_08395 [Anaerocolumna sedimenticola]|uniref:CARDB domain-containing protein n=1 Tax=Anaerocolumna sedimenticola TaxID=2696063 RepID=A0A6P1TN69_9FIRM|nr:hypothetical protein [Anaerocolumna sedimenticola]QHQ60788.1 hypothetical protein Ana3638_08395 [Anaerocolumna sedimenticola]
MKRVRKICTAILTLALILSNIIGNVIIADAETYSNKATAIKFEGAVSDIEGIPGETVHVKLPVRAINGYIFDPLIRVDTNDMPFTVSNISYSAEGNTPENPPAGISDYEVTYIEFDVKVKESAKISRYKLKVSVEFTAVDHDDESVDPFTLELPTAYLVINKEKEPAQLTVDNIEFNDAIIGNDTKLSFLIKNEGEITAHDAYFSINGYDEAGIIPRYSKLKQSVDGDGNVPAGSACYVELPVSISSTATAGTKKLTVKMEYKNEEGETGENSVEIYLNIKNDSMAPKIEVVSTKYASELKAGDSFNLVATLRNTGEKKADEIEVSVGGLGTSSFLPGYTTKTIAVKDLKFNNKIDVKIPLIVSHDATAGLKEVPLTITYKDDAGVELTTTSTLYLEVVSADGVDADGKPNIVVSNVSQNPAQPNAGLVWMYHLILKIRVKLI